MALNMIAYKTLGCLSFILLNLVFSTQAAYAAPIIMMAQNRQNEETGRKRKQIIRLISMLNWK
jgi:uncharacterized membrane protein